MFQGATSLTGVDLTALEVTGDTINMTSMLQGCRSLNGELTNNSNTTPRGYMPIEPGVRFNKDWDTSNVREAANFANGCYTSAADGTEAGITRINLVNFWPGAVEAPAAFADCRRVEMVHIENMGNGTDGQVTDLSNMLLRVGSAKSIKDRIATYTETDGHQATYFELSNIGNTPHSSDMSYFAQDAKYIRQVNAANIGASNDANMRYAFSGMSALNRSSLSNVGTGYGADLSYMMSNSGLTDPDLIPTRSGSPVNDVQIYLNGVATGNQGTESAGKTKLEAFMMGSFSAVDSSGSPLVAAKVYFNADMASGQVIDSDGSKRKLRYDAPYGKLQSAISMFSGCTGLVRADLQGLPNVSGSWGSAFAGCTQIKEVRQADSTVEGMPGKENAIT